MKKNLKTVLLCSLAALAVGCSSNALKVKGDVAGLEDQKVYLVQNNEGIIMRLDSAEVKGGKFELKDTMKMNDIVMINFEKTPEQIVLYVGNSTVELKGKADDLANVEIKGSKSHNFYKSLQDTEKEYSEKFESQNKTYMSAMESNDTVAMKKIEADFNNLRTEMVDKIASILTRNPDEILTAFYLSNMLPVMEFEKADAIYQKMSETVKSDPRVESLKALYEKTAALSAGKDAPAFSLKSVSDSTMIFTQDNLKGKKSVVFISVPDYPSNADFFAAINKVKGAETAPVVIMLSQPGMEAQIVDYAAKAGIADYTILMGDQTVAEMFMVNAPIAYVFDAQGKIVGKAAKAEEVEALAKK